MKIRKIDFDLLAEALNEMKSISGTTDERILLSINTPTDLGLSIQTPTVIYSTSIPIEADEDTSPYLIADVKEFDFVYKLKGQTGTIETAGNSVMVTADSLSAVKEIYIDSTLTPASFGIIEIDDTKFITPRLNLSLVHPITFSLKSPKDASVYFYNRSVAVLDRDNGTISISLSDSPLFVDSKHYAIIMADLYNSFSKTKTKVIGIDTNFVFGETRQGIEVGGIQLYANLTSQMENLIVAAESSLSSANSSVDINRQEFISALEFIAAFAPSSAIITPQSDVFTLLVDETSVKVTAFNKTETSVVITLSSENISFKDFFADEAMSFKMKPKLMLSYLKSITGDFVTIKRGNISIAGNKNLLTLPIVHPTNDPNFITIFPLLN